MPTFFLTRLVILITLTSLVGWGPREATAAPGTSAPNIAQIDLVNDWVCPVGTSPTTMPDLRLSLTTTGGPLWVTLVLGLEEPNPRGPEAVFEIFPVLDGQPQTQDTLRSTVWPGIDRSGFGTFTFMRAYQVAAGAHTVSWQVRCLSELTVLRGWTTVYELPSVRK